MDRRSIDLPLGIGHLGYNGKLPDGQIRSIQQSDIQVAETLAAHSTKPSAVTGAHTHDVLNTSGLQPETHVKGRDSWDGGLISGTQVHGYDLKRLSAQGQDTGRIYRSEIIDFISGPAKQEISAATGARLDG